VCETWRRVAGSLPPGGHGQAGVMAPDAVHHPPARLSTDVAIADQRG
jgi:hypothetical protein